MEHTMKMSLAAGFAACALFFTGVTAQAQLNQQRVANRCQVCHAKGDGSFRGLIKAGTQTDSSFDLQVDGNVWHVQYDKKSKLKKFTSAKQLRDDKAVKVLAREIKGDTIIASNISYKGNLKFIKPEMIMEIDDLGNLLKKSPEEANYVLFDVRGYGDYIDGHLPGAVSLPYYRMTHFKNRLPKDKDTLIVTYCNSYG